MRIFSTKVKSVKYLISAVHTRYLTGVKFSDNFFMFTVSSS